MRTYDTSKVMTLLYPCTVSCDYNQLDLIGTLYRDRIAHGNRTLHILNSPLGRTYQSSMPTCNYLYTYIFHGS